MASARACFRDTRVAMKGFGVALCALLMAVSQESSAEEREPQRITPLLLAVQAD